VTLKSICENVAADLGIDAPLPPIFGSRTPVNRRLFAQARKAAKSLARKTQWTALVVEHQFTADGSADFELPEDFWWLVDATAWEVSRYWSMRGAMSPQQWRFYKNSIYGRATIWRRWRIRLPSGAVPGAAGAKFSVDPPVPAGDHTSRFVFEYVSTNWCLTANGTTAADWTADTDRSLLDEDVIELGTRWRMLRRLGLSYDEDKDEYERELEKLVSRDGGTAILDIVPHTRREDFIGQYTLGAFPPTPPPTPLAAARPLAPAPLAVQRPLIPAPKRRIIPPVNMIDC